MGVAFRNRSRVIGPNRQSLRTSGRVWSLKVRADWSMRRETAAVPSARSHPLQGHVAEEVGHRLAIVGSPDRLSQDHGYIYDLVETTEIQHHIHLYGRPPSTSASGQVTYRAANQSWLEWLALTAASYSFETWERQNAACINKGIPQTSLAKRYQDV